MPPKHKQSSDAIVKLLATRHSKDVFVPECKDGPTHYVSHMRLDAWTMNKSWAHPCATGYEIKVSRSDFLQDNKWHGYLPLCNQFYFVAPKGLIDVSELAPEAGLLAVIGKGHGTRLLTQKKAPHRDIELPEAIYRYILMCRVSVTEETFQMDVQERGDAWRRWLKEKKENQRLGWQVSRRIRERATEIEIENARLA